MWSGGRLTKIQTTTRPDYVCRSFGQDCSSRTESGTNRNLQKISRSSKNAPTLRGICTTDPDDREYSDILKDARRKLERPSAPAMPCERHPSIVKTSTKPKIGPEKELKTMCDCPLRAEKFGVFISADHKVISEGWESRDNHRYVVVVCVRTTRWNLGKHVRFCHGITALQHLIDPRQMSSLRLCGMLMPSAKCPRPPGRWDNAIRKTLWRTIQRANNTLWSNGRTSSVFTERPGENSSIWKESITSDHSRL